MREAAGVDAGVPAALLRGDFERAIPFPFAAAVRPPGVSGDGVRPMTGGVAVREGGGVGRLIAGLSQDEKKSSSCSGVAMASSPPSATTSPGCLLYRVSWVHPHR